MTNVSIDIEETCPICLDDTYTNWVSLKVCGHNFHQECIDLWLEKHTTCPICVREVSDARNVTEVPNHRASHCVACIILMVILGLLGMVGIIGWSAWFSHQ